MAGVGDRERAIGLVLAEARKSARIDGLRVTQRALATRAGIEGDGASVTISRIENGQAKTSEERLEALAVALGMTLDELNSRAEEVLLAWRRASDGNAPDHAENLSRGVSRLLRTTLGGHQAERNHQLRAQIDDAVRIRQEQTEERLQRLRDAQREAVEDFLEPYAAFMSRIELTDPSFLQVSGSNDNVATHVDSLEGERVRLRSGIVDTIGSTAAGAGAGAAAGAAASAVVMTWVGASATASTGVAIGSLSGAAATSATLAWLGGGSLAAGGLGVAGGALVLASIITIPALLAAGGVLAFQARRMRAIAGKEADALDLAERELDATDVRLRQVWHWLDRDRRLLERLTTVGMRELRWLEREAEGTSAALVTARSSEGFRTRFLGLLELAVTCTAVLRCGLPILENLEPTPDDDPGRLERAAWIELLLTDAEEQLADA